MKKKKRSPNYYYYEIEKKVPQLLEPFCFTGTDQVVTVGRDGSRLFNIPPVSTVKSSEGYDEKVHVYVCPLPHRLGLLPRT